MDILRKTDSVRNRVHKLLLLGNDTPEIASSTELFPDDWSPHTMICGNETWWLRLCEWRLLMESSRSNWSLEHNSFRASVWNDFNTILKVDGEAGLNESVHVRQAAKERIYTNKTRMLIRCKVCCKSFYLRSVNLRLVITFLTTTICVAKNVNEFLYWMSALFWKSSSFTLLLR